MILTILGLLLTAAGIFVRWKFGRAREDKARLAASQQEAAGLREGLKATHEANAADRKAVLEILDPDLSDDRAAELLNRPHARPKVPDPAAPRDKGR